MNSKELTTETTAHQADQEAPTNEGQRTTEKDMRTETEQVDLPTGEPETVDIDLSGQESVLHLESTCDTQAPSSGEKKTKAPIELIITNSISKQAANVANGRKVSANVEKAPQVAKSGHMRHIIAVLALSSILVANMNRQAYNQALVRMIKRRPKDTAMAVNTSEVVPPVESSTIAPFDFDENLDLGSNEKATDDSVPTSVKPDEKDEGFDWTGAQISLLQAGFSYGYTFFMIPGGRMSEIYGAKWVIFLSSFGSALCSLMTPFLANTSYELLVASRIVMGLCQTGISPALYALYSRWLPPEEASVYLPMIKVGVMLGFTCGSMLNTCLSWQRMFYLLGILGFAWSALWAFFASSAPSEHKFINKTERDYIENCLELHSKRSILKEKKEVAKDRSESAPWLRIIKNPIVLAFTFTKFTVKLSTDTQAMQIPMYLNNVFQISDQLNGNLNGANFAIQAIFTGIVAYVAKEMVVREQFGLKKTGIRRMFQAINCFGMGLAYLLISFNMGSLELVCCAVILLSITSMFGAGGEAVLPIDLTTEYSASIMAIANSAANLSGIILPPIVSFFLANQLTSTEKWNHVWWFISGTMTCGGLAFTCIVKAKIQGFNEGKKVKQEVQESVMIEMDHKTSTMSRL